jgi:hypothetical protein
MAGGDLYSLKDEVSLKLVVELEPQVPLLGWGQGYFKEMNYRTLCTGRGVCARTRKAMRIKFISIGAPRKTHQIIGRQHRGHRSE